MTRRATVFISCLILGCSIAIGLLAQQAATEAPAGFDTPMVVQNPGSQSAGNGMAEPAGDSFALDQKIFETVEDPATNGLGPVFNATSCAGCHQNPVTGGPSGRGWPFGRAVHRSEVLQLLDQVAGVDHVDGLVLSCEPHPGSCGDITIGRTQLALAGSIRLTTRPAGSGS